MDTIVLKYDKAKDLIDNYDKDPDSTADTIKELLEYVNTIDNSDWEYVMIEECAMAGCGIMIHQMVVKE